MSDLVASRAIIFDLFGTLVDTFSFQRHEYAVTKMAALVCVPRTDFAQWYGPRTGAGRLTGQFATVAANIEHICTQLAIESHPEQVSAAAALMIEFTRESLRPRDGAIEVLTRVKSMGYKLGLISDCSPAVPLLWPETPFASLIDVPIFSCTTSLRKPDPRIYELACERLGVSAEWCMYIGDGSSNELRGASEVGMHAILFACDYADSYDAHRPGLAGWRGPAISCFEELLPLAQGRISG